MPPEDSHTQSPQANGRRPTPSTGGHMDGLTEVHNYDYEAAAVTLLEVITFSVMKLVWADTPVMLQLL
jgi:hypothetical protein